MEIETQSLQSVGYNVTMDDGAVYTLIDLYLPDVVTVILDSKRRIVTDEALIKKIENFVNDILS